MAILFDETDDYYVIADDAALSLADEDWCIGIWTRVDDNSGTLFQYLISSGAFSAPNAINIYLSETGAAGGSHPDEWNLVIEDSSANNVTLFSASAPGADGKDRLVICQRHTGNSLIEMHFCEFGQTSSLEDSASDASLGTSDSGAWNIGRRTDGSAARYYGSIAGEFFMGKFALSSDEITVLGSGMPIRAMGKSLVVDLSMQTAGHTQIDLFGSHDATENSAPTTAEHFKMRSRSPILITRPGVAVGGTTPKGPLGHPLHGPFAGPVKLAS